MNSKSRAVDCKSTENSCFTWMMGREEVKGQLSHRCCKKGCSGGSRRTEQGITKGNVVTKFRKWGGGKDISVGGISLKLREWSIECRDQWGERCRPGEIYPCSVPLEMDEMQSGAFLTMVAGKLQFRKKRFPRHLCRKSHHRSKYYRDGKQGEMNRIFIRGRMGQRVVPIPVRISRLVINVSIHGHPGMQGPHFLRSSLCSFFSYGMHSPLLLPAKIHKYK